MEKGKLSVQTAHILPIIKKWLYSEKEIFIRELISNSFDAVNKLKKVSLVEDVFQPEEIEYAVDLKIDRENKIIIIEDNGIGMDVEEIKKYITQIAFSGAKEFVNRYEESHEKGEKTGMIGNFGIGFYSSFMIAKKVEIDSRSYRPNAAAAYWSSEGGEEFEIGSGKREKRGTTIRLHLEEGEDEFLEKDHLSGLVRRYCDFIPMPIRVDGSQVNREKPLWSQQPSSLKKEDYTEFYRYLFPTEGDPLFYVHLNVDYPFKLQGILYFPRMSHELDLERNNVKIYCKQVFVSNESQDLIPKYLTVLQGVLDLPELPLNVSRSYLQNEPQIKKIATHITKKVADRLTEEFKSSREEYEKMWPGVAIFIKFGVLNDEKFYDQVKETMLFEVLSGDENKKFCTLDEYLLRNKEKTDGKIYYAADKDSQSGIHKLLQEQGIEVLLLETMIDTHFVNFLERKNSDYKFLRVDSDVAETLLDKTSSPLVEDAEGKSASDHLKQLFAGALKNKKIQIRVEALKSDSIPAMILLPEHLRRLSEMAGYMGRTEPTFPDEHTLLLNSKNSLIKGLSKPGLVSASGVDENRELAARQIYSLARLSHGRMSAKELGTFINENYLLIQKALP